MFINKCNIVDSSSSCSASITSRTWDFGDGENSTEPIITHTYAGSGTYIIRLTIRDAEGNEAATEKTVVLTNLEKPQVDLGRDTSYCSAQSVTLNAGNPGSTYLWSSGSTSQTINVNSTHDYSVTVTNAHGCSTTDSIHLNISADTLFSVDLGPDKVTCEGSLPQYQLDAGNPGLSYVWTTPAGAHQTTQTLTTTNAGIYSVAVTDGGGCRQYDSIKVFHIFACNYRELE